MLPRARDVRLAAASHVVASCRMRGADKRAVIGGGSITLLQPPMKDWTKFYASFLAEMKKRVVES